MNEVTLPGLGDYQWQAQDTLFVLAHPGEDRGPFQPFLVDARTGKFKLLTALSRRLGMRILKSARSALPSPDGKWILFLSETRETTHWMAAALDGSRVVQWPYDKPGPIFPHFAWLPDSRHWIYLQSGTNGCHVEICGLDTTAVTQRPAPAGVSPYWFGVTSEGQILAEEAASPPPQRPLAPGAGKPTVVSSAPQASIGGSIARSSASTAPAKSGTPVQTGSVSNNNMFHFVRFALDGSAPEKHFSVRLPGHTTTLELILSPHADRVALLQLFLEPSPYPWMRWLHVYPGSKQIETIWEGQLDEGSLSQVGPGVDATSTSVLEIRWTPDGKRLSFLYDSALYTMPVD